MHAHVTVYIQSGAGVGCSLSLSMEVEAKESPKNEPAQKDLKGDTKQTITPPLEAKEVPMKKKYLIHFASDKMANFRTQEIKSIVSALGYDATLKENDEIEGNPILEVHLENDTEAKNIMGRSVLSKHICEAWAEGSDLEELKEKLAQLPREFTDSYSGIGKTFRITVSPVNKNTTRKERVEKIEYLTEALPWMFEGDVNLEEPDVPFCLLEFYQEAAQPPPQPLKVYFGRWVADGQRHRIPYYSLKKRKFIASTSTDATRSLVMSNMAQVKPNDLVIDPFVGTGSLLVSSAHFGAYVMGTDTEYALLHGRTKPSRTKQRWRDRDESVYSNMRQYGLEARYLDVLVADASLYRMWRGGLRFDAIVTVPPLRVRGPWPVTDALQDKKTKREPHCPQRAQYHLSDIYKDLLNFAADFLVLGGRLVFCLAIFKPKYEDSDVPSHPCLKVEVDCEELSSSKPSNRSLRIYTMVKISEPQVTASKSSGT